MVGYSRLTERDEDRTLARLKAHRQEFVEPPIAEYQGRVVKLMGSGTAYDQLHGKLDLSLEFAGEQRVKNIERLVRAYRVRMDGTAARLRLPSRRVRRLALPAIAALLLAIVLAAGVWRFWPGEPPAAQRPGIAVLPLDNLSGDERTGRLADGITEDVITDLARFRYLDVIARNSVETYKGKPVDVRQVGRELGVRYVLEGSLQADPERARVTVQLIDAATGAHLWSERYDRPPGLLLQTRDEVTAQIAATLTGHHGPLAKAGEEVARRKPPGSLQAYEHLLLAGAAYGSRDKAGTAEARRRLEKALEVDPGYARAWTFLAWTHFDEALYGYGADREASWAAFHDAAPAGRPSLTRWTARPSSCWACRTSCGARPRRGPRPGTGPWR